MKDLVGQRFGNLVITSFSHRDKTTHYYWNCLCDCGNVTTVSIASLKSGRTRSCGCWRKEVRKENRKNRDLVGQQFYRLTITKFSRRDKIKGNFWEYICICGNTGITSEYALISGHVRSCGCLRKEAAKEAVTSHGKSSSRVYNIYHKMIQRCSNPKNTNYKYYGLRGIAVCSRWLESFEDFYEDMRDPPEGMTLDRIDNNGPYCKENCRWVSAFVQMQNTKRNRIITIGNISKPASVWIREAEIKPTTFHSRLSRGWSEEKALTAPVQKRQKNKHKEE